MLRLWQYKRQNRTRRTVDHWRVPIPCDDDIPNMGRSPNYGRNSNILIPDPYH